MKLLLLLLCISYVSCFHLDNGPSTKEKSIQGVTQAIKNVAFQAAFEYRKFKCAAAIIHKRYAVLPASCVVNMKSIKRVGKIRVGTNYRESEGEALPIDEVTPHSAFDPTSLINNIALIKLGKEIEFKETQNYIKIINFNESPQKGNSVVISGFGSTQPGQNGLSAELNVGSAIVISETDCKTVYKTNELSEETFCISKGATKGDNGGSVVINGKLAGIISRSGGGIIYSVCTNIAKYYGWLQDKSGQHL